MDFEGRLLSVDRKYKKKWMNWVPALMQIQNLKKLEVQIDIGDTLEYFSGDIDSICDKMDAAEEKLLAILQPKMLRGDVLKSPELTKNSESALEDGVIATDEEETEEDSGNESLL